MAIQLGATAIFGMFCFVNLLNCIDRGIIPGAPIEFQAFIQKTHHVDSSNVSIYIGLLQSIFIGSYSIFICVFGYLSMTRKPFQLMAISLFVWILSIVMCGLAKPLDSFYLLLFGRLISGIGEASFHATAPPFIDEFAPPAKRTLWLGCYYATFSIGQALGFSYGSVTARTVGWDYGFYLTAVLMVPVVYACYAWIPAFFDKPLALYASDDNNDDSCNVQITTPTSPVLLADVQPTAKAPPVATSFLQEAWTIVRNPVFLGATLGLAAFTFTMNGMIAFAPAILIGYELMDESIASTAFGGIVVLAGLLGSPLSGYMQDRLCAGREHDRFFRLQRAAAQMAALISTGVALLFVSVACMHSKVSFFVFLFGGFLCVFGTQTVTTIVLLMSVDQAQRGFAMGLSTFLLHLFGDVPAGVVLGALKDTWAPHCGSKIDANGKDVLDPECHRDKEGLRYTLAFAYGWLLWTVLCYVFVFVIACKWYRAARTKADASLRCSSMG